MKYGEPLLVNHFQHETSTGEPIRTAQYGKVDVTLAPNHDMYVLKKYLLKQ